MAITITSAPSSTIDVAAPSVDFSTGIPQDSVQPPDLVTPTYGENPWDAQQRQQDTADATWRTKAQDQIDKVALDPDSHFKGQDLGTGDPERVKRMALNSAFLEFATDGAPVPTLESDPGRHLWRAKVARERFNGRGAESEDAFHAEIIKDAQVRRDRRTLVDSIAADAAVSAAFQTVGGEQPVTFATWKESAKAKPGYDPAAEPDYFESWHRANTAIKQAYQDFETPLSTIWFTFQKTPDEVGDAARRAYDQVPEDQRPRFMAALKTLSQKLPKDQQPAFWSNLRKQTSRDVSGFYSAAKTGAQDVALATDYRMASPAGVQIPTPEGQTPQSVTASQKNQYAEFRKREDFISDITAIQQTDYDPMKYLSADSNDVFSWRNLESHVYASPGAIATSLSSTIPGIGFPAFFLSSQESIYQDYRRSFQASGMSYTDASQRANSLAPIAALPQVLAEKFQIEGWAGKLPFFEKAVAELNSKITSRVAQLATRSTVGMIEEGLLEQGQDYIPAAVQDIAHGLSMDVPDVQWLNGKDGVLDGFWKDSVGMMVTMLPLAIFGAAHGVVKDSLRVSAFAEASDKELLALGITPEKVSDIRMAKGLPAQVSAIDLAMEGRDPTSETAKAAVIELKAQQLAQAAAQKEAESLGAWPTIARTPDGYTVRDSQTGDDLGTAKDLSGAMRIAQAQSAAMDDLSAEETAYLGTMLEAADTVASRNTDQRKVTTEFNLGQLRTLALAVAENPASLELYTKQIAIKEVMEGGDGETARQILGDSKTAIGQNIRATVNRLFKGAAVTDVFHEDFHGIRREARAAGRITRADEISLLRALDQILAGKTVRKDGTQLRFIPDGMTDDQISETLIDEAMSEIGEMEILRSRKGGTMRTGGNKSTGPIKASPGMISRNLTSLAKILAPQAVQKWTAFFRAIRARFGLAMSRALALKKAERDGQFDAAGYEQFLNKMLGTDAQAEHDAQTAELAASITGDAPFSIAPSSAAKMLEGDAISRIKDPIRRAQAMSRIARNFEGLRLQLERLELLAGTKRLRRSLAKEAAMREAIRAQELENEAYARHWQVFSNEDLTKIKSQPVHAYLSNPDSHLHGRLMSRSAAIQRHPDLFQIHRAGDYDESEGVNRSVFGGQLMPDQAAQELFDNHLIPAPTADAMWNALLQEQRLVESMKQAETKAKDAIREARQQAKRETNDWLKQQTANQDTNFSPKQESLRALASLDAILAVLPAEIRGRIGGYTQIARLGNEDTRLEFLRAKLAVADKELEAWLRAQFGKEFEALLKRARPEKDEAGQKPRGKIGATIHDLFRSIERAMAMPATEVEAEAVKLESLAASGDYTAEETSHMTLEANLIRLAGDWLKADAARREAALIEATRVFESGYLGDRIKRSKQRETRNNVRESLRKSTNSEGTRSERKARAKKDEGTKTGRAAQTLLSLLSFEQITQWVFGENTPEAKRFADWERAASNAKEDAVQGKLDAIESLFESLAGSKLKGEQLRWKLSQDSITVKGQTFSELEAITATLMWRQEDGRRHMEGHTDDSGNPVGSWHYDQAFIDQLEDALSPEAKAVRLHLGEQYAAEYDRLNSVFQELYGVSMPRHKHYSPLTVKPAQAGAGLTLDPVTGAVMSGPSLTPGSLRNRSQSAIAEPDFRDALQTYIGHVKQMEHWIAYAPFATEAMAILNARELGNSIEASSGKEALSVLRGWIDYFAQGGTRDAAAHLAQNRLLNRIMSRAATMALVGRVSVLAIQATQLGAALAEMPANAYLFRLGKLFSGQLDWRDTMKSDYIQRRIQQMPAVVQQAMEGLRSSRPTRLRHTIQILGKTISGADALFTAGTYAMIYDYQLAEAAKMGLSGEDAQAWARQAAERGTDRVAQPTRAGARSLYETTSTHPMVRLGWAFASEARQKLALSAYALAKRSPAEAARALTVTFVFGGMFASIIRASIRDARDGGDDKELFDAENWDMKRLALSAITGPLQGIPALGDAAQAMVFGGFNEFTPGGNMLSALPNAAKAAHHLFTADTDLESAVKDAEAILTGAGLVFEPAAEATTILHIVRDSIGITGNLTK